MESLILEKKISWTALIAINTRDVLVVYSMRPRFLQKITFFFVLCVCVCYASQVTAAAISQPLRDTLQA